MHEQELRAYAGVVLDVGIGMKPGKDVAINAFVEHAPFARIVADEAYKRGAALVDLWYWDAQVKRSRLLHAPEETLGRTPAMLDARYDDLAERKGALINIVGDPDPDLLAGIDPRRAGFDRMPGLASRFRVQARGMVEWTIVAFPTDGWAKSALGVADADLLWAKMVPALRLDQPDPVAAWHEHMSALRGRADSLNDLRLDAVHYEGPGVDLTVGLHPRHFWRVAEMTSLDSIAGVVNLPTEEIYTAPDPLRADGVIRASMPLALSGSLIEGLMLRFESGQIVEVQADSGADIVRGYIATDPGASRLGEVALVDGRSPVAQSGVIFLNTLFDENASCHIAFGDGIRTAVRDYDIGNPASDDEVGFHGRTARIDRHRGDRDRRSAHVDSRRSLADRELIRSRRTRWPFRSLDRARRP